MHYNILLNSHNDNSDRARIRKKWHLASFIYDSTAKIFQGLWPWDNNLVIFSMLSIHTINLFFLNICRLWFFLLSIEKINMLFSQNLHEDLSKYILIGNKNYSTLSSFSQWLGENNFGLSQTWSHVFIKFIYAWNRILSLNPFILLLDSLPPVNIGKATYNWVFNIEFNFDYDRKTSAKLG